MSQGTVAAAASAAAAATVSSRPPGCVHQLHLEAASDASGGSLLEGDVDASTGSEGLERHPKALLLQVRIGKEKSCLSLRSFIIGKNCDAVTVTVTFYVELDHKYA